MDLSAIVGQTKAINLLHRALQHGRLAHAYLFAGPDGVGKTTTALALSQILLCQHGEGAVPCNTCPSCIKFKSGNHPDFVRICPDGVGIKIDQIRTLKKALGFKPFESPRRVVLLEDAHTMRREAGNSLLKVLEEPPADNILLLVSNASMGLLETIVSRCQVIPFHPLPVALAAEIVRRQKPELGEVDSLTLASLVDGCPGQALSADSEDLLALYQKVITSLLGNERDLAKRIEKTLALAATLVEHKTAVDPLLALLRIFFKNLMVSSVVPGRDGQAQEVAVVRERWNLQQLSDKIEAIGKAERALARNCNRSLTVEVLLFHLFDCSPSTL